MKFFVFFNHGDLTVLYTKRIRISLQKCRHMLTVKSVDILSVQSNYRRFKDRRPVVVGDNCYRRFTVDKFCSRHSYQWFFIVPWYITDTSLPSITNTGSRFDGCSVPSLIYADDITSRYSQSILPTPCASGIFRRY